MGFVNTSVRMPLPVRATFLRARERPSGTYYMNYWGADGGQEMFGHFKKNE